MQGKEGRRNAKMKRSYASSCLHDIEPVDLNGAKKNEVVIDFENAHGKSKRTLGSGKWAKRRKNIG